MKKTFLFPVSLLTLFLLLESSCQKRSPNVAPEPDTEFQSSVDASHAALVISDIDMLCSFVGGADLNPKFYLPTPSSPGTIVTSGSPNNNYIFITFNNTKCADGRVRNGSIYMYYGFTNPNAKYYHDYEFQGKISLINYQVDGWAVELKNTFIVTNKLSSPNFNPAQTNLSWSLNGDFILKHPSDSNKNIHCNVDLLKTLANTYDKNVYNPTKLSAITWSLAIVKYNGVMFGETSRNVPFKYSINEANPLVRDFTCFPDKVAGISNAPGVSSQFEEFHPFKDGRVNFVTNGLYPRDLSYGNEQSVYHDVKNEPLDLSPQCDNKGVITIKGISYTIDFAKDYK